MGSLDSDADRGNAADYPPNLDIYPVEPNRDSGSIPSRRPRYSCGIGRTLHRLDYLLARVLVDECRDHILRSCWSDQRALSSLIPCVFVLLVTLMRFYVDTRSNTNYCTQRTEKLGFAGKWILQQHIPFSPPGYTSGLGVQKTRV